VTTLSLERGRAAVLNQLRVLGMMASSCKKKKKKKEKTVRRVEYRKGLQVRISAIEVGAEQEYHERLTRGN